MGNHREASQRTVDRNVQHNTFGDYITQKGDSTLLIGFQNFNGFTGQDNDPVDYNVREWITNNSFDVFGISEINLYWPKVKKRLQFQERMSK